MSAVQFIFRGEACWRGGEEFREGFNLSAWIWGRAAARFEPGFPVHVHDAPFCLLKELFPLQPYKYFLERGKCTNTHPFAESHKLRQEEFFFNTWYSFKLSSINLTPSSVFHWVPHRLPYSLRVLLSQYLHVTCLMCVAHSVQSLWLYSYSSVVMEQTIYRSPC